MTAASFLVVLALFWLAGCIVNCTALYEDLQSAPIPLELRRRWRKDDLFTTLFFAVLLAVPGGGAVAVLWWNRFRERRFRVEADSVGDKA